MGANTKEIVINCMGANLKGVFEKIPMEHFERMQEIRIRRGKPLMVKKDNSEFFIKISGMLERPDEKDEKFFMAYKPTIEDINKILEFVSNFSLYAFEEEIRNGYITIAGGHRIGLTGKAVLDRGSVKTIKNINGLNFRLSHQVKGCADSVIHRITNRNTVMHTMIISPPCCGKTTLLRDIIRQISNGFGDFSGQVVGLVDERSEIAGCYLGEPQNDVGMRTDVLDACPKAEGMMILLRAMSPAIIAVDEIGRSSDINAIDSIITAGIKLICSVHGKTVDEIQKKPYLSSLLEKKVFERFIVLDRPGRVAGIYNEDMQLCTGVINK